MRAERVRWRLARRGCFWRSWTSSSLQDGEVKKQPVFDDQKVRQWGARAVELPRVSRQCDPAKYNFMAISAGRGHIRARKLRVAARGGSGALAGSARWLRASRGGVRRAAGRSATHLARNAGRPGGKSSRQRRRADGRRRRTPERHQTPLMRPRWASELQASVKRILKVWRGLRPRETRVSGRKIVSRKDI